MSSEHTNRLKDIFDSNNIEITKQPTYTKEEIRERHKASHTNYLGNNDTLGRVLNIKNSGISNAVKGSLASANKKGGKRRKTNKKKKPKRRTRRHK
jgi:hypothetical protein